MFHIFFKYLFLDLITCYLYVKISNFNRLTLKHKLIIVLTCIILSIIYTFYSNFLNPSSIIILSYIVLSLLYTFITKYKLNYSVIVTFISLAITLILFIISTFISLFVCISIFPSMEYSNTIIFIFAILLELLAIFFIFRIKRFKNGFSFLKNAENNNELLIFLCGIVLLIFARLGVYTNNSLNEFLLLGIFFISISIFIWIKERITSYYKSLLIQDTIQDLENKLKEEKKLNKTMKNELKSIALINHKYSSRISSLELYVKKLSYNLINNKNINNDLLNATNLVENLSNEYSNELLENLRCNTLINKTDIISIDNMLEYFSLECINKNILFNVIVKSNITHITEKSIPLNLLETLLADMIKNSIIAISYSDKTNPKILIEFDYTDYLEIRISDTGIEFEIDTLLKLGKEKITTHKSNGGSGIGFFTTFEILDKTKGSIIIEEYERTILDYSKCIIFKFDNKKQYIIRSYRAREFKKASNDDLIIHGF